MVPTQPIILPKSASELFYSVLRNKNNLTAENPHYIRYFTPNL